MSLNLINELFNNVKENKLVKNFMDELSNYLENNVAQNSNLSNENYKYNNLNSENLTLYNTKIIAKIRDEMLIQRNNILQNYAKNTQDAEEMYYIYNTNQKDTYNLCICNEENSHEVITKKIEELPEGSKLGSIIKKKDNNFVLDTEATKTINKEINTMIQDKIKEQKEFLDSKRIEGHIYEVGEKYLGRIWLYDLNNKVGGGIEGIEEIEFPKELYNTAKEGDLFIYKNGEYQKNLPQ